MREADAEKETAAAAKVAEEPSSAPQDLGGCGAEKFDFDAVDLPKVGEKIIVEGAEVTVMEPMGRNGLPLRSKFYKLGAIFDPQTKGGHNFLCCVPVKDPGTGEWRRCGALLKIPKGSLGNPFRHIKQKHGSAYQAIMEEVHKAKAEKQKRKNEGENNNGAVDGQGSSRVKRAATAVSSGMSKKQKMVRKCVTFCASQLLPLDVMKSEGFLDFVGDLGKMGAAAKSNNYFETIETAALYKALEEESASLVERMRKRILEIGSDFFGGLPFLHVAVDAKTTPCSLIRICFANELAKREEVVLVTKSQDLANLCLEAEGQGAAIAHQLNQVLQEYDLEVLARHFASVSVSTEPGVPRRVEDYELRSQGYDMTLVADYLKGRWEQDPGLGREEIVRVVTNLVTTPVGQAELGVVEGLRKELDVYEDSRREEGGVGPRESFWQVRAAQAGGTENGGSTNDASAHLPILYKVACSVQVASPAAPFEYFPILTPREARIIDARDFLAEDYKSEHTKYTKPTLLIKYNQGSQGLHR